MRDNQTFESPRPQADTIEAAGEMPHAVERRQATPPHKRPKDEIIQQEMARPGLRGYVNAKCVECVYDELEPGTWREQVAACTCQDCPLFPKRPGPYGNRRNLE